MVHRWGRLALAAGQVVGLGALLAADPAPASSPRARPLVGAIRWDAWTTWAGENRLGPYEQALGPSRWHSRLPFYARIIDDQTVEIRADSAAVMDQEIAYAAAAGLDYWAFDWYHPRSWPHADTMGLSLNLYRASPHVGQINYCLILLGGVHLGPKEEWPQTVDNLVEMFKEPTYQKVLGDRPLVYVFNVLPFVAYWGGEPQARAKLDLLRTRSQAAGAGNPYVALMVWNPPQDARLVMALGADALSAYVNPPGQNNREEPYSHAVALNRWFWREADKAGVPLIPTVTSGWDYRPMKRPEFPDRKLTASWVAAPTPTELAAHLKGCLQWIRQHPESCPADTALVYAWNEFAEGGWLCPTLSEGSARLDAIGRVLRPPQP